MIPTHIRAWIYRVAVPLAALAVAKGWIGAEDAPLILDVLTAVLAVGVPALAAVNTPTTKADR